MNEPKSTRYQRLARRAKVAEVAASAALLALLAFTPAARWLADAASAPVRDLPGPLRALGATVGFVGLLSLLRELLALPVVLHLLSVDRRFGRAESTARNLLGAHLHTTVVGFSAALVASVIVLSAPRVAGSLWWLAAGGLLALALAGALRVAGAMLPALGDARPITRRSLMSGLREIARRSGVPISDILEWPVEGERATALVTGLGSTCRVFVASEVLRDWSDDEIAVVVAHELAHHVHRDLWRTLALDAGVLSMALWAAQQGLVRWSSAPGSGGMMDPAALPLIALMSGAVWLAATPLRLAQSRAHERRADRFALQLTGEAGSFGAAIRRLSARYLAEERPSRLVRWFFYRHPPVAERLALAESFGRDKAS